MPAPKPTMKDVARIAGVSPMTVSRYLTEPSVVSESKAEQINAAIEKLGYVPNRIAGSLSSNKTGIVAAIVPALNNSNFADSAHGLTEALKPDGYQLLIGYTDYSVETEEQIAHAMIGRRPEAIVLTGSHHSRRTVEMLVKERIPVVEIWDLPTHPIDMAVGFSNYDAGRAMTDHLISLGYRRIVFIGPSAEHAVRDYRGEDRMKGYQEAMAAAGLPGDLIINSSIPPVSFRQGSQAVVEMLEQFGDVDAIFAVSDLVAVGALAECQRRGIGVPDDIGIAGFGNFEISSITNPALTTMRVKATDIGRVTGELVVEALSNGSTDAMQRTGRVEDLGFEIVNRQSTVSERGASA